VFEAAMITQADLHCSPGGVKWAKIMQVDLRWAASGEKWAKTMQACLSGGESGAKAADDHAGMPAMGSRIVCSGR
jgi:hypothetical protein